MNHHVIRMPFKKLPQGEKRVKLNITLAPDTISKLKALSTETGQPISRIIDILVHEYQEKPTTPELQSIDVEELIQRQRDRQATVNKLLRKGA